MRNISRQLTALTLALAITTGTLTAMAQTKSKAGASKGKAVAEEKEKSRYNRLPTYFGQLELTDEQKESVYAVKTEYGTKIEALEEELKKLKEEMNEEVEGVLTSAQKTALAKLRDGSAKARKTTTAAKADSEEEEEPKVSKAAASKSKAKAKPSKDE